MQPLTAIVRLLSMTPAFRHCRFTIVSPLLVVLVASYATASLEVQDDSKFGTGAITSDTVTGLDWLDVTASVNISYDQMVLNLIDPTSNYYGWRHATHDELAGFFQSAGIDPINTQTVPAEPAVLALMAMVGITYGNSTSGVTVGHVGDAVTLTRSDDRIHRTVGSLEYFALATTFSSTCDSRTVYSFEIDPGARNDAYGHWLVRALSSDDVVPEPSTAMVWTAFVCVAAVLGHFNNNETVRPTAPQRNRQTRLPTPR